MSTKAIWLVWVICTIVIVIDTLIGDSDQTQDLVILCCSIINLNIWTVAIRIEEKLEQSK